MKVKQAKSFNQIIEYLRNHLRIQRCRKASTNVDRVKLLKGKMRRAHSTDLSDKEWEIIQPKLLKLSKLGNQQRPISEKC